MPVAINRYPVSTPILPTLTQGQQGRATRLAPQRDPLGTARQPAPPMNRNPTQLPAGWPGLYKVLTGQNALEVNLPPGAHPGLYQTQLDLQRNLGLVQTANDPLARARSGGTSSAAIQRNAANDPRNLLQGTIDSYQKAYEDYLAAVEGRYQDIAQGYKDRYGRGTDMMDQLAQQVGQGYQDRYQRGLANLEGLGQQELRDVQQRYSDLQRANQQDLVSRGLTGTTILPTMNMGVAREMEDQTARVNERLQRERLGLDASLSGDMLGAQERLGGQRMATDAGLSADLLRFMTDRNDIPPDLGQLIQLAQLAGAGGQVPGSTPPGGAGGGGGGAPFVMPMMGGMQQQPQIFGFPTMMGNVQPQLPVGARTQMGRAAHPRESSTTTTRTSASVPGSQVNLGGVPGMAGQTAAMGAQQLAQLLSQLGSGAGQFISNITQGGGGSPQGGGAAAGANPFSWEDVLNWASRNPVTGQGGSPGNIFPMLPYMADYNPWAR